MPKINVGVQAMMLKGKFDELGAYDTLKKVHELGYGSVEISQIPMNAANVDAMRRAQDDFGIKIAAVSAGVSPNGPMPQETIATHFDKIVADCKALDCNFVRIGMLPFGCMASLDEVLHFCRMANVAAQKLADQGIKLYYHNHHIEFQRFEGKLLLDIIRENADKLGFELDVHWIHRGGCDPVKVIADYAGQPRVNGLAKSCRMNSVSMRRSRSESGGSPRSSSSSAPVSVMCAPDAPIKPSSTRSSGTIASPASNVLAPCALMPDMRARAIACARPPAECVTMHSRAPDAAYA